MGYQLEELVPVVAQLVRKYTSGESTSVTYEKPVSAAGLPAEEAYRLGYEATVEKTKRARESYHALIARFCAYGSENYHDTVTRALPGIDAVERYVEAIGLEQEFLGEFPEAYVREVLGRLFIERETETGNSAGRGESAGPGKLEGQRKPEEPVNQAGPEAETNGPEYEKLERIIADYSREELKNVLAGLTCRMIRERWRGNQRLAEYLLADLSGFIADLEMAAANGCLPRVVVL